MTQLENALFKFRAANKKDLWLDCIDHIYEENKQLGIYYLKQFRKAVRGDLMSDLVSNMDLLKRSYRITAKDSLDDYMTFVEWNRDPSKKFWAPRRRILLPVVNEIQRLIDGDLDMLSISLPPGTGKTTLKCFLLSQQIGVHPDMPNLDSGHAGSMTQSTYDGVLQICRDPEYLWPELFPGVEIITNAKELTIDAEKKHRFSSLTARAIGASLTGATRCENILSADDLVSGIEEATSKERLDKKWDAYANDLKSRKKLGAKELHIATRWSVHDVIGRLEREYAGNDRANFIVVPALNEDGESNFNYDYGVGFDTKFFEDMRHSMDAASFKALYMGQPIEREGLLYDEQDLRRFYELPEGEADAILAVCDTAAGGGDFTVMPIFAVYGNDHYLIDCVCSDALPEVTDVLCADALMRNKVQNCQFESNSAGGRTADKVHDLVSANGRFCHITKKWTSTNKETKIIVESTWVKQHCLFRDAKMIKRGTPYGSFMQQMLGYTFTGKNAHDDVPDALAQYSKFYQNFLGIKVELLDRKSVGL